MVLFIILPCDHAAGFCGYFCCGYTCAFWLTGSKTFKCDIKNHGVLKLCCAVAEDGTMQSLWIEKQGQCTVSEWKSCHSSKVGSLLYIFVCCLLFLNYLNWKMKNVHASCFGPLLVVGGVAGTKRTHTHCHENILERFPADYGSEHCLLLDQYFSAYHSSHTFSQRDFSSFFLFLFVFSNGCLIVGISAT